MITDNSAFSDYASMVILITHGNSAWPYKVR